MSIEFHVQGWRDNEWATYTRCGTLETAEEKMLYLLGTGVTDKVRVVEFKTVITHKIVAKAANMGTTDEEIVSAVVEGRHL